MSLDYGSIQPGYKNPLAGSGSIKGDYDWGSFSKGIDWGQTPGIDRSGLFESLFDKAKSKDKYRSQVEDRAREDEMRVAYGGSGFTPGGAQRVTESASIYTPSQIAPFTVQGVQGRPGVASQIAGIAAPFANLIPGAGPFISAGLGGLSQTGW